MPVFVVFFVTFVFVVLYVCGLLIYIMGYMDDGDDNGILFTLVKTLVFGWLIAYYHEIFD